MTTETEEFEFRARAEREHAATPKANPQATDAAVQHGLAVTAAEEENPNLVSVGKSMMAIPEAIGEMTGYLSKPEMQGRAAAGRELETEHPLTRPVKTATDIVQGAVLPAIPGAQGAGAIKRALTSAVPTGAAYGLLQPTEGKGSLPVEKAKQAATGGATAGAVSGAVDLLRNAPGWLRTAVERMFTPGKTPAVPKAGPGAEQVTGELQRQRDVLEGRQEPVYGGAKSDTALSEFEGRTKALRDKAFATGAKIDTADTVKAIDDMMLKNPDKQVQAALREVKNTIDRATKGAAAAALPQAGARMTPQQLKAMQGKGSELSLQMADEVRQSINRLIEQSGDKALSPRTKDLLGQVRERFLKNAPAEYRGWLAAHASGKAELDKLSPETGVLGKTTTNQRGAAPLTGTDAQDALERAFKGNTATRDLKQLVEATGHDAKASEGLRESFGLYLLPTNQAGHVDVNAASRRWNDVKGAVKDSGLFSKEHYEATDKVMTDIFTRKEATESAKQVAGALGSLASYKGAVGARTAVGWLTRSGEKTPSEVQKMIEKVMVDERAARAGAAPPTPKNLEFLRRTLEITEARDKSKRRVPNVLGMRPQRL